MSDAIKLNEQLKKEALAVIQSSNIEGILKQYGGVSYGGSFVYGTMVDRDIDIAVLVNSPDELTKENRDMLAGQLIGIKNCTDFSMSDRKAYPKPHRPKGVWFGLELLHDNHLWNIDIWLVTKDEPLVHTNEELFERMLGISEEERGIILDIKYNALINDSKVKGVTSSEIYKAVLYNGVTNYEEWKKYLKDNNI